MTEPTQTEDRGHWGSKLGFIVAAVGSAVGLGNIWKFPYIVGESGGAAFIFVYLLCIGFVGFPILIAEWMIGRRGQKNPLSSMVAVAKQDGASKWWGIVGFFGIFSSFIVLSFYSVIGGWTMEYIGHSAAGDFVQLSSDASSDIFSGMLESPLRMLLSHSIFMAATMGIVAFGVGEGIEKAAKFLMPALLVILVALLFYAVQTPGFGQAFEFLFSPHWDKLTPDAVLTALGHAFFTLTLGLGVMISYGSFLDEKVDLVKTGAIVVGLDTIIALSAGMVIFPIVFTNGLDATSGPGLLFQTLPIAFGKLPAGEWIAMAFFILLCFAALTSSISLLEPSVELIEERFPIGRKTSTLITGICIWAVGIPSILSMNLLKDFRVIMFDQDIFTFLDYITSMVIMPLAGMFAVIFCGWVMNQEEVQKELGFGKTGMASWAIVAKFLAPLAVLVVFLHGLGFTSFLAGLFE